MALLLLERGARSVTVIDTGLNEPFFREHLANVPGLSFYKGSVESYAAESCGLFELIVASSVTEHVLNLAEVLQVLYRILRPGGAFFTAHDNYYQPCGHHDGFMVVQGPQGFAYPGPHCWEHVEKCSVSSEFRMSLMANGPWAWDAATENALTPLNCTLCPLYKRARPWAHLIYADEFLKVFPQEFFSTGRPHSGLNKITPFMLRQFIVEAGFEVELWQRNFIANEPPDELLCEPHCHNPVDLKTVNILARGRRLAG